MDTILTTLFVLRHKIHMYHLHARGVNYLAIHKLFKHQYEEILEFADRIAEHLLSSNNTIPTSLRVIMRDDMPPVEDMCLDISNEMMSLSIKIDTMQRRYPALDTILGELDEWLYKQTYLLDTRER